MHRQVHSRGRAKMVSAPVLPRIKLDHLRTLTDDRGILQHAKFSVPNRVEGYATDDNARALVAVLKLHEIHRDADVIDLIETYLGNLYHMQKPDGSFHNYMTYDLKRVNDELTDSLGRALWACGYAQQATIPGGLRDLAKEIFDRALPWSMVSTSPRVKAFALMGLCHYGAAFPTDLNAKLNAGALAERLVDWYRVNRSDDWAWFEPYITYCSSRLPQALFLACNWLSDPAMLEIAKESFAFLSDVQTVNGAFVPIGNERWYHEGEERSLFDQQPIEAACTVEAASTAFSTTREGRYLEAARLAFSWFLGRNPKGVTLYDPTTGGCHDGITREGMNLNQGAEATVSYLLARLELEKLERLVAKRSRGSRTPN